jgi:hypothetical protein
MKTLLLSASLLAAMSPALGLTINFDSDVVGQPPAGWNCGITGRGHPHWTVEIWSLVIDCFCCGKPYDACNERCAE